MSDYDTDYNQPQRRQKQRQRKVLVPYEGDPATLGEAERKKFKSRLKYSAFWHLNKRDHSRHELETFMRRKVDVPSALIPEVLDELEADGYINDARFTEQIIYSRVEYRKLGKSAVRMELLRKGVASETVDAALEDWDSEDETERAYELVRRKLRATRGKERQKRVANLVGMLARKGYPSGVAFAVVKELLDEDEVELAAEREAAGEYAPYDEDD